VDAERSLSLSSAETRTLDVVLTEVRSAVARLDVTSGPPGADVIVDGERIGTTPIRGAEIPAGERIVRVDAGDGRFWEQAVEASAGRTLRIDVDLPGGGLPQGWFWGAVATAAAAGVGVAATGGYAMTLHDEYVGASPERQDEIRPTGEALQDAADALIGVAGAAAVGAVVLFFFTDFGEAEPSAEVDWLPADGGAGDGDSAAQLPIRF
jgi:hypothetical protein